MTEPATETEPATVRRPRRLRRWLLLGFVLLLTAIGFLPTLLGSRWIYQPLIDQLALEDFRLSIDAVQLRWLSPLRLEGVRLTERDGQALLGIRQVKTDRSLIGYLIGGRRLGRLEIIEPTVSVELLKDGGSLQRVIQAVDKATGNTKDPNRAPPAFDIDIAIEQCSAKVLQGAGADPLVVVPPFNLQASYQAASGDSHLKIEPTEILKQVKLTKELIDLGLGHAVPLLAKSAWFDGNVSLAIGAVDVPLKSPQETSAAMQLTLHEVRSGPNDPAVNRLLDFIARMRKRESVHELVFVNGSVIDVTVADKRVHHTGLEFGLPKMDSRFQVATSGFVGVQDRTLDLMIAVPVPVEQLARRDQVKQLGVPTLNLPITGTLDDPQVNWNAMRGDAAQLLGLIRETLGDDAPATASVVGAIEGLANGNADEGIAAAVDLIQQIRERRQAKLAEQAEAQSESSTTDPTDHKKQQPVRDALRDFFKRK